MIHPYLCKYVILIKSISLTCCLLAGIVILGVPSYLHGEQKSEHGKDAPFIVELTQTPCTIIESEANPQAYISNSSDDCVRINKSTLESRKLKVLRLKPGRTLFRVTNKNVNYELGFWVRGRGVSRITLPSTSGGGLIKGSTKDYFMDLKKGEYLYSCPLNPTPDYSLIVE